MTTELLADEDRDATAEAERIIAAIRESVEADERHWFITVLDAVGQWPLAEEEIDGRHYRYLVGGEAFDWLLLAERLCKAVADLTPEDERAPLTARGHFPVEVSEEEFRRLLGPTKHRAHLNFLYGVQVEKALQLRVAREVEKEQACQVWSNGHIDEEVYNRVYGATRPELLLKFREQQGLSGGNHSTDDLHEFTYWLFKRRVNSADPARVASDTRKGLAMLSQMGLARR